MPNIVNKMVMREMTDEFKSAEGMLLVSFAGLTVTETEALRNSLAEKGVKLLMVRNRLARIVFKESGVEFDEEAFLGNTAVAYGDAEAAVVAAKVFGDREVKKAGKVKFKAGLLDGEVLDAASAASLANIPDRETLHAQMLGVISGPARSLVGVLSALLSGMARVISAHADQAEEESSEG